MIGLKLLLAVTSCVLPLIPWLDRVIPRGASYRYWLLAGYSTLLGMVFVTVLMRLLNTIGITLSPTNIYMSLLLIFLAGFLVPPRLQLSTGLPPLQASQARNSKVFRAITLVCLGLIAFRLLVLGMEVATRPIFAWD